MKRWLPHVRNYVNHLAAIGGNHVKANGWTRCSSQTECYAHTAIVEAAWGACTVPPYIVLAEWDDPDDWYRQYQPVLTAFVAACDPDHPPLLMIPIHVVFSCGYVNHRILLVIDREQRLQTVFDPHTNQTDTMSPFQELIAQTLAERPLIEGYKGAAAQPVAPLQDAYEFTPPCTTESSCNNSSGCCTVMFLLMVCVCHRFHFRDVALVADLLVDVATEHGPNNIQRLRENLWGWQACITAFGRLDRTSVATLRAVVGLSDDISTPCAVDDGGATGPCHEPGGWDGTAYCRTHCERLLPEMTDAELDRRIHWFQSRSDEARHPSADIYQLPPVLQEAIAAGRDEPVWTGHWNGYGANLPVMVGPRPTRPFWLVLVCTGFRSLDHFLTVSDRQPRPNGGVVIIVHGVVRPTEAQMRVAMEDTFAQISGHTVALFLGDGLVGLRTTTTAAVLADASSALRWIRVTLDPALRWSPRLLLSQSRLLEHAVLDTTVDCGEVAAVAAAALECAWHMATRPSHNAVSLTVRCACGGPAAAVTVENRHYHWRVVVACAGTHIPEIREAVTRSGHREPATVEVY